MMTVGLQASFPQLGIENLPQVVTTFALAFSAGGIFRVDSTFGILDLPNLFVDILKRQAHNCAQYVKYLTDLDDHV